VTTPRSKPQPPSTKRLRRWIRQRAFRTPRDLQLETPSGAAGPLVISFPTPDVDWRQVLSPAEIAVAEDALAGLSNAQIAAKREAAVRTIANQMASVYRKVGVRSRLELSLYALAGRHTFGRK
jgi:DNA-binding NarL/FixJ family response regulator